MNSETSSEKTTSGPAQKETTANEPTQNDTAHTHSFQAEVQAVLRLVIHSLYSNKEIFLRELVSNASDACDKLRFDALKDESLLEGDADLGIEIEVDEEAGLLTVRDNGIGMSNAEVIENLGTIARSGTRQFLESLSGDNQKDAQLIGQFGVGFYSAFIVADEVTVLTRRAGDDADSGTRWVSDGSGEFTVSDENRPHHGTELILKLKPEEKEFLSDWTIRSLVNRYSDHIGFPIRMRGKTEQEGDQAEWETINQASALWTLPKTEISDEEYQAFYRHVSHDMEDALNWTHNRVEGNQNYTTLLYVPSKAPFDLLMQRDDHKGLRLYVKRVFIMDAAEQLLPHYLRFVRGVVDSDDLPLNVSRELLQNDVLVRKIRSAVIRRSLDMLQRLSTDEAQYPAFWSQFGAVLKEGIVEDIPNREKIAGLLRFASSHGETAEQTVSLSDYIARMPEDQKAIWFITAENHETAANSPHLEIFRKKGIEVLLLSDRIDEWMMGYFTEFDGKPLRSVSKGDLELADTDDAGEEAGDEEKSAEKDGLLKHIGEVLGERVSEVRESHRLTDSASCLVLAEQEMAMHMRRLMEQAGQPVPGGQPALEVNLSHPLLTRMAAEQSEEAFSDYAHLVHDQAVLAEGGQLPDPAAFVRRLNRLMLES
jgi:molecular chaperone HtpG